MKRVAIMLLVLLPVAQTFGAEQLTIGMLSVRNAESNTDRLEFSTTGLDFAYWNFLGNDKLFFGLTAGISTGQEKTCSSKGCANIELTERAIGVKLGWDIDLWLTPFVSLNYVNAEFESSIPFAEGDVAGKGSTSYSEDETSYDIGTWFGDPGDRVQFALEGYNTEEKTISFGRYKVFGDGVTWAIFFKTPKNDFGSSWGVSTGVGWSF